MKYTVAFLFSESLEYVSLIKKAKPDWQKGRFNGIGGKIEDGETAEQANRREFYEETGVDIEISQWSRFAQIRTKSTEIDFFTAKNEACWHIKTQPAPSPEDREEVCMKHIQGNIRELMTEDKAVENLIWLIFLARDHLQDNRPSFAAIHYDTDDIVKNAIHETQISR